jgi:serine/threonine protein kinase
MAELFLAQEPPKPELVVLKRILPYLSEETEFVQMFLDEARIAAQLHHPNIVQVYELGKLDNTIFIAMEFVEGVDLRRVVQEEAKFGATVPYGVAAAICAQVAEGLDYAHFSKDVHGVPLELIHRDVSPQNVMVGYNGRVKIVDFGIAKAGTYVNRSKPGVIKGKFLYLSPEQVAQDKLDHRADIFALGTMMYEITTGKSPFAKPTTEGILYAIRSEDPSPPHLLKDDYPIELSRIIMRCLLKDRAQRYQRAAEVQADLKAFLVSGVLKQSTDISDYIARLMGEEEERTVLHIPVASAARKDATAALAPSFSPVARKDATAAMSPGLMARPRRVPDPEPPVPDFDDEREPPTQMARPSELLAQRVQQVEEAEEIDDNEIDQIGDEDGDAGEDNDFEDDDDQETGADVSTTIGTMPAGFTPPPPEPGESTVHERGRGRSSAPGSQGTGTARRAIPPLDRDTEPRARRPNTPPSRRPLADEELPPSDPSAPSISLTQPTGQAFFEEEEEEEEEEEMNGGAAYEAAANSISVTPPTTGQRRRLGDTTGQSAPVTASTTGQRRRLLDEPSSKSNPVTQPSVNMKASRQRQALMDDELPPDTDAGVADDIDDDANPTEGLPANLEDDESTAGYDNESQISAQRSRWLILAAVGVVVLLLLGLGLYWALGPGGEEAGEMDGPPPASPITPAGTSPAPTPGGSPTTPPDGPAESPTADGPGTAVAAAGENPSAPTPGTTEPVEDGPANSQANLTGGAGDTEKPPVLAANGAGSSGPEKAGAGENGSTATAVNAPAAPKPPPDEPLASVVFKTNTATIRVSKKVIEPNKLLTFPPGKVLVEWSCAKKWKREGSDVKLLKPGKNQPIEIRCSRKAFR